MSCSWSSAGGIGGEGAGRRKSCPHSDINSRPNSVAKKVLSMEMFFECGVQRSAVHVVCLGVIKLIYTVLRPQKIFIFQIRKKLEL